MRYEDADQLSKDLDTLIEEFDAPSKGLVLAPGLAVAAPLGGMVSGHAGARPVALASAKKSSAGVTIFTLILLAAAGFVVMKVINAEPKESASEEGAKVAAAMKVEKEREVKIEEERKNYAQKQREKKLAEEKKRQLNQARFASERAEQKKRDEEERAERENREAMAKREAERQALEDEKKEKEVISEFEVEDFLKKELEVMKVNLNVIQNKKDDLLDPVFGRLERELKRKVRRFVKGRKGDKAQNYIEEYMKGVRDTGVVGDLDIKILFKIKEELDEVIEKYREKRVEALLPLDKDKDELRLLYIERLKAKQIELLKKTDEVGAATLDEPISSVEKLDDFMELFE